MRLVVLFLLALVFPAAHATCLFARDTKPGDWYRWAAVLIGAEVASVEARGRLDIVSLDVTETFKGPANLKTATLEVPNNLWQACRLKRPLPGEHVLGALNANNDALVVPLTPSYAQELRHAGK
ncbi:MAG: hypothetical protein ABR570_07890 [Burkholderiales bacterium]